MISYDKHPNMMSLRENSPVAWEFWIRQALRDHRSIAAAGRALDVPARTFRRWVTELRNLRIKAGRPWGGVGVDHGGLRGGSSFTMCLRGTGSARIHHCVPFDTPCGRLDTVSRGTRACGRGDTPTCRHPPNIKHLASGMALALLICARSREGDEGE